MAFCYLLTPLRWEDIYLNTNFFLLQKKVTNSTKEFLGLVICRELLLLADAHLYLLQPPQLRVSNRPVNLNRRFLYWRKILSVSLVQRSRTPSTQSFKKQQMLRKRYLIHFLLMPYFCSTLWYSNSSDLGYIPAEISWNCNWFCLSGKRKYLAFMHSCFFYSFKIGLWIGKVAAGHFHLPSYSFHLKFSHCYKIQTKP